ncbi:MAG: hypothetical protein U5K30_06105 [Acidimicrobiales bacterium]|nr:hypothetical protein [Acidimicrobiales bacterium]
MRSCLRVGARTIPCTWHTCPNSSEVIARRSPSDTPIGPSNDFVASGGFNADLVRYQPRRNQTLDRLVEVVGIGVGRLPERCRDGRSTAAPRQHAHQPGTRDPDRFERSQQLFAVGANLGNRDSDERDC